MTPAGVGTRDSRADTWERGIALVATLIVAWLHVTLRVSAGGLWRDESVSIGIASLPSLTDIWRHLQCDSFPMLWPLLLRSWASLGSAADDPWLRTLGLLIGLAILGVLWLNARLLGCRTPTVALTLLGFNAAVICYGDSVRGYGLGMLSGLLAFGLLWSVSESPRPWLVALALVTALVAVHSMFYNCIVLLAACAGGAAVCLRHRRWGRAALVAGIGAVCAMSVWPYTLTLGSSREWVMTVRYDIDLGWLWTRFRQTNAPTGRLIKWLWVVAAAGGLVAAARAQLSARAGAISARQRDVALYCGAALAVGIPAYVLFLRLLRYKTNPWYYLALMALIATCLDGCGVALWERRRARLWRTAGLAVVIACTLPALHAEVSQRKTNVDLIAARLEREADPRDLIVISPWVYGHTFRRYYRGTCRWTTLPEIEIPHLEGDYGLLKLKRQMMDENAVQPVLAAMGETLSAGHRVWWIGILDVPPPGSAPPRVEPAPHGPLDWNEGEYHRLWGLQAGAFIGTHAGTWEALKLDGAGTVNRFEDVDLAVIEGWRP